MKSLTIRRSNRCRFCGAKLPKQPTGRPRHYCSSSHRQMAYEKRRQRHPLALLHRDIDTVAVRAAIRREVIAVLQEAGLLPPSPPPAPKPSRKKTRLVLVGPTGDK